MGGSYVLNIDARWGEGKTYFLTGFQRDLAENYTVAYVNAWEDDHADDPLLAMMSAVTGALSPGKSKTVEAAKKSLLNKGGRLAYLLAKHSALAVGRRVLGEGADLIVEEFGSKNTEEAKVATQAALEEVINARAEIALSEFENAKQTISDFKASLALLVSQSSLKKPIFILIDELDRCRPAYAISLLERIKHLFDVDGVVFVLATDTSQLRYSIGAVYGAGFDGAGYLLRFFDRTYRFATPELGQFVAQLFERHAVNEEKLSSPPTLKAPQFVALVSRSFGLTLRDVERCHDVLRSAITMWPHRVKLELLYLYPLIVASVRGDDGLFQELSNMKPPERFKRAMVNPQGLRFAIYPATYGAVNESFVSLVELLDQYFALGRRTLPEIGSSGRTNDFRDWVVARFRDEFAILHSNMYNTGNPPLSVCGEYSELVRSVGRLSANE
jgi:hypothetical protein